MRCGLVWWVVVCVCVGVCACLSVCVCVRLVGEDLWYFRRGPPLWSKTWRTLDQAGALPAFYVLTHPRIEHRKGTS